jgi:hypothetical protein
MSLSDIDIQWVGFRKDSSSRGAIVGWFVPAGYPKSPLPPWEERQNGGPAVAFMFRGKIGKKLIVEEHILTAEFVRSFKTYEKNYKTIEPEKIAKTWGGLVNEELSMSILMMRLKYPCKPPKSSVYDF